MLSIILEVDSLILKLLLNMCIQKFSYEWSFIFFGKKFPYDLYFLVCYRFRGSISYSILDYTKSTICFNSQQIDILNSLADFKQLTQLEFRNSHSTTLTPSHVLERCPNLKHLKYVSDYQISESAMSHVLGNNCKLNINFIASLSHLDLSLSSLLATRTRYFVDCFPNQLTILTIWIRNQNFFKWIDTVGMELALKHGKNW